MNVKPDVYLFTAKEAGDLSKNNDKNTFDPHSVGNSLGKFWVPVSAEVLKLYLNVENSFVLLNQYPNQVLSGHPRAFVATLGVSAAWFSHLSWKRACVISVSHLTFLGLSVFTSEILSNSEFL